MKGGSGMKWWKIRVVFDGGMVHLVSIVEPIAVFYEGQLTDCKFIPPEDDTQGDTVGFINWHACLALTWRAYYVDDQP